MSGAGPALVTGGSGYFGSLLADRLEAAGVPVRVFDLVAPDEPGRDHVVGDVRDLEAVRAATEGCEVVFHNVAQVPLARDRRLFWSVNVVGTANVLVAARDAGVAKVVHTSSSAVFGIPERNPVTEDTPPRPVEDYGRAKLRAELVCRDAVAGGLDVTIVRPRTILGHGRLGIMGVLFELVAAGAPVFVIGAGDNRYQFVHADDLAEACRLAARRAGPAVYNVGATEVATMRETLEALCAHAGTGSRVRSLPAGAGRAAMEVMGRSGLAPLAPYHWHLYGRSLWFDTTRARTELGWEPAHSGTAAVLESYDWYLAHRDHLGTGASHHRRAAPARALGALRLLGRRRSAGRGA